MERAVPLLFCVALAGCATPTASPVPPPAEEAVTVEAPVNSKAVARVNDEAIAAEELQDALRVQGRAAKSVTVRAQTLDAIIRTHILLQQAKDVGVPLEGQKQLWQAELLKRLDPLGRKIVARHGTEGLRHERRIYLQNQDIERLWEKHCASTVVADDEVKANFDEIAGSFGNPERAWLEEVFVSDGSRADALLAEAQKGRSMDEIAQDALGSERGRAREVMVAADQNPPAYQVKAARALKIDEVGRFEHRGQIFLVKKVFHQAAADADLEAARPEISRRLRLLKCTNSIRLAEEQWFESAKVEILYDDEKATSLLQKKWKAPADE